MSEHADASAKRHALTLQQILWQARELAKQHDLYIVEVQDKHGERYFTAYIVYRKSADQARGIKCGKRRDPHDVLALVRSIAGVPA